MPIAMPHQEHQQHEWSRAKPIRASRGFTFPQLVRYANDGLIRTSHIRRPGQTRGVRLFHLGDIDRLIAESIENPPKRDSPCEPAVPGGPLPTPAVRIKRKAHRRKIHHDLPIPHDLPSRPADEKTKP